MSFFVGIIYKIKRIKESPLSFLLKKLQLVLLSRLAAPFFYMRLYKLSLSMKQEALIKALDANSKKISFFSEGVLDLDAQDCLFSRVAEVLEGRYECLGYGRAKIGSENWLKDCIHEASWPSSYFTQIDVLDRTRRSDIKIVWEKSRLQFLPEIAMLAVNIDGCNEGLVDRYFNILADWDNYNPLCFGPNWVVSMEVAIRSANILLSAYILFPYLSRDRKKVLARILNEHYLFLRWFPEISDIEGNHSLATKMGLYLFESLVSKSPSDSSDRFLSYAERQFTEDGFHIEYSPTYHRLCVEIVMVVYANEIKINGNSSSQFSSFVKKILECCNRISILDSTLPVFGDNDSGHVFNFGQSERDFSYLWNAAVGTEIVPCFESRINQSKIAFKFWSGFLGGKLSLDLSVNSLASDYVYPFKVVCTRSARLIMRIGAFGLKGRAPHDHDDNLSFVLQAFGKEIITDKGCPPYTLDPVLRNDAISSLSHNVVQIKDVPRSVLSVGSIFKTVQGAAFAKIVNAPSPGEISAVLSLGTKIDVRKHDHLIEHFRTIHLSENGVKLSLRLSDNVAYQGVVQSQHRIHFAPNVCLVLREDTVLGQIDNVNFTMTFKVDGHFPKIEIQNFDFYDCYGHSVSAKVLLIEVDQVSSYTMVQDINISNEVI